MARIFTTGAEESSTSEIFTDLDESGETLSDILVQQGYTKNSSVVPRTGRGMYAITSSTYMRVDYGESSYSELYFGFAINVPVLASSIFFYISTDSPGVYSNYGAVRLNVDGTISAMRSSTSLATSAAPVITADAWYYIEIWFKPLNSGGRFVVKVDGATVIDYTGDTTNDLELINAFRFLGVSGASQYARTYFDDIVVNDSSGSYNNTYPGMVRLLPIRPEDGGNYADWTRAGVDMGTDEAQARDGAFEFTMLQTVDADDKITFTPELPDLPVGATITNIVISARARVESGSGVIAPMVRSNGTDDISADQDLTSTWRYHQYAWPLNPDDSAAWAEADLATLEIGVSS